MIQLLLAYAAKAAVILVLAAALAGLAARADAAFRHAIWSAGVAAALFLLPLAWLLPRLSLGLVGSGAAGMALNLLVLLWLAVAAALLLRILFDQLSLHRLAAASEAVTDDRALGLSRDAAAAMGVRRAVRLRRWDRAMPATFGTLRPIILLPDTASSWPTERLKLVLLHEMGHVARLDTASLMLARIVRAVHWFNPLSWRGLRRIRTDCEQACDERVLRAGAEPLAYARALLETMRDSARTPPPGALAMTAAGSLEARLERICSRRRPRPERKAIAAILALAIGVAATMLAPLRFEAGDYRDYGAGPGGPP